MTQLTKKGEIRAKTRYLHEFILEVVKKVPRKRKRLASLRGVAWLSGFTSCLAPISTGHLIFKVYLAGDSNQPHPLRDSFLTTPKH